ncbi:MAG: hypothetical protein Q9195_007726 [Heterodermia aff. obscurata]
METREEKLATWIDPSIARTQYIRLLTGSLDLTSTDSNKRVRILDEKIPLDRIEDHLDNTSSDNTTYSDHDPWCFKAHIQHSWSLHPRTIEVFLSNNGLFASYHCPNSGRTSLLLKVAASRSTGFDCVSVTRDPAKRTIYVFYHHLEDEASVFATLLSTPECCIDLYFFVAALYRSHHQHIETHRNTIDYVVLAMERRSGLGNAGRLMSKNTSKYRPSLDDPKSAIQQLSDCQTDLAIIGHVARCASDCGEWLIQVVDQSPPKDEHASESAKAVRFAVREELEYTRRRNLMVLSQVQQMRDRAQSQTNFILSTITQSDADYTAAIAIDGKRDGIAMKTIAILGILFLPGTFVATLFSMDMFHFADSGKTSSLTVSPSLWIYWAISVPLTIVTLLAWVLWSRKENLKSVQRLTVYRAHTPRRSGYTVAGETSNLADSQKMV